jgi:Protein of unknown function (DUF2997)
MPGKQEIEFVIRPDGTVEERVLGVAGPECEEITSGIEQALGIIAHREHSSGYFSQGQTSEETLSAGN